MLQNIKSIEELKITNTNDIKEIKMYQTKDQKKFETIEKAIEHENKTRIINHIIELLGGNYSTLSNKYSGFNIGEGYIILNKKNLEKANILIQEFKKELGYENNEITDRVCHEDDYLYNIAHTLFCIRQHHKSGELIRVGQPFYKNNQNELKEVIFNKDELTPIKREKDYSSKDFKRVVKKIELILMDFQNTNLSTEVFYQNETSNELLVKKENLKNNLIKCIHKIDKMSINHECLKNKQVLKLEEIVNKYVEKNNSLLNKRDYIFIETELKAMRNILNEAKSNLLDKEQLSDTTFEID